ncbi:MAG TPA: MBL fold metallo-hydrolase [Gemmataceae bacterium]|jgi:glyoxylase-like metal-dependent hydrolase (beta-lactamase superfamily II)/ferredoxin|nr:MBL fold metallo-hydrolase [Gemmataceae bacterium]
MANLTKRLPENVPGDFFVDSTCIDCDTCRQLAPASFGETGAFAYVHRQPQSPGERRAALQALVSCPTGSIGCRGDDAPTSVMDDFPLPVEPPVFVCGFNSRKSYGGNSYFLQRQGGNWLIDAPKFQPRLVRRLEELGGVANIFLTHRDDVADADRYAAHFRGRRYIHREELAWQPDAEVVLEGHAPLDLAAGIRSIPTPGHTGGHCCLLVDDRYLFTGDHLGYDRHERRLDAHRDYCWGSWARQTESMRRLLDFEFAWILPGHGQRIQLEPSEMRRQLAELVERMAGKP